MPSLAAPVRQLVASSLPVLLVTLAACTPEAPTEDEREALGAGVLTANDFDPFSALDSVKWFTPSPDAALDDVPATYTMGCHVDQESDDAKTCDFGDPDGDITIVATGDSKMAQWWTALDEIGHRQGWKFVSLTKSSCGFNDAVATNKGRRYTSCTAWNANALAKTLELHPDAVLTSQMGSTALANPDDLSSSSEDAMVLGLVRHWSALADADIPVIVLLDNPRPNAPVFECVEDNRDDLSACTFAREEGEKGSGAPTLSAAVGRFESAQSVDMAPEICPQGQCLPVIGNVLVYRMGSHLTDTYVKTLAPALEGKLAPAIVRATIESR